MRGDNNAYRHEDYRNERNSLTRDTRNKKIAGICSGLARYLGTQALYVRLVAVIAFLIAPHAILIAYAIAYFCLDTGSSTTSRRDQSYFRRRYFKNCHCETR